MSHATFGGFPLGRFRSSLTQSLGLNIPLGLCVSGQVVRARLSSRIRLRHALTEKAWGDAVQGLGKAKPTLDNKGGTGSCSPSYSLAGCIPQIQLANMTDGKDTLTYRFYVLSNQILTKGVLFSQSTRFKSHPA